MAFKDPEKLRAYKAAWREANRDKLKKYRREYYESHKEKHRAQSAAWDRENPQQKKRYYQLNKERIKERVREYGITNREAISKKSKERHARNKEVDNIKSKAWREANPSRVKQYYAAWRKANPEIRKVHNQNRRARKKYNGGTLSKDIIQILWKRQKGKCAICKADLRKTGFHLDHIVPLIPKRGEPAGKHEDKNVQLACPTCNTKKNNKNPIQFMQEMGYLL